MKKWILVLSTLLFYFFLSCSNAFSQCGSCTATTYAVNLSSVTDSVWTFSDNRNGNCCTGSNCIRFNVTLNPASDILSFDVQNPSPSGSAYYQINCGPQISIGTPACINGQTTVCITYCKPGGDSPNYFIHASRSVSASADITLRQNCTGNMSVVGLIPSSVTWTSVFPGIAGQYNSYLSCPVGCSSTNVTPTASTPSYIDYRVTGIRTSSCPGINSDTVRVYVVPPLTVNVSPANPSVCSNGSSTVTLNSSVTGGSPPYTYSWSNGPTTPSVNVSNAGVYTVNVSDNITTCGPIPASVTVIAQITPVEPVVSSNSPVCVGNTLTLTANSNAGSTYFWTGPNGFTSSLQNPSITNVSMANAGTYNVTATINGCVSETASITVNVNPTPPVPDANSNSPLCSGNTLNLTSLNIPGATYLWTGPNGFNATTQNASITNVQTTHAGMYTVTATVNGCSNTDSTAVVINQTPVFPTAGNNGPLCTGATLNLSATSSVGSTYSWTGPGGFTSSSQNPSIANVQTTHAGTYVVTATANGCSSAACNTTVSIFPTPSIPVAGSNSPVCAGNNINLTANNITGANYSWTGPNGFTSSLQNPTITNAATIMSGTYFLTVTVNGCISSAGTVNVTVNPIPAAPVVSGNSPVCQGTTINLSANTIVGATYSWTGPNGFTSSSQNPTIANAQSTHAGTYSATIIVSGCTSPASSVMVIVNPTPATPIASNNGPLCVGNTLNLTAGNIAGATYSWTGPNGFSSALQNPSITNIQMSNAGVYSVTATISGCTGSAGTTTLTVKPTPAAPNVASNSPVCTGQTITLTSNAIAGATYAWTGPGGYTSSLEDPTRPNSTVTMSGTYSLIITVNGCPSAASSTNVNVSTTPASVTAANNGPLCTGATLNLTSNTVTGATYTWTGPNGFSSAQQNPTLTNVQSIHAGTYSVTATITGCTSAAGTTTAVINPIPSAPTAGSNSPVCAGNTINLTANNITGATYTWTGPNGFTSTSQNPTLPNSTLAMSGTYSVNATVNGCTSAAGSVNITVNPIPAAPAVSSNCPICQGATLNLTANSVAGATYSWTGPNGFTSNVQNPTITNAQTTHAGVYTATITVSGCTGSPASVSVVINVIPATPTASNNGPLCVGNTLSLTAGNITGANYTWTGPNGFTSNLQNPSIPNIQSSHAGVYSVTATVNGCTSSAGTTTLTVKPTPAAPGISSNSPVCSGQTILLTSNTIAGATYSWTGPAAFTSSLEDPTRPNSTTAMSGNYSMIVTVNGCPSAASTTNVVVNSTPIAPTAGNNGPLCTGTTLNLSATSIAGATYSWTGPAAFTSSLEDPVRPNVQTTHAGTYSVTATLNGCTSAVATTSVVINNAPSAPVAGSNSPICAGSNLNLTASNIAGATYSWTGPGGYASSLQNPTRTNTTTAMSGNYSVTATINGCTSVAGTVTVTVNPVPAAPTASNSGPVCVGGDLNLFANTIPGATYSWTGPNGFSSSLEDPFLTNVTAANAGTYTVTVTVAGCTSAPASTTVIINPLPPAPVAGSNSPVCTGQTLNLTAGTITNATYLWNGPNGFSSTLQNPSIPNATNTNAGTYTVTATVNGCTSAAGSVSVIINATPLSPTASSNSPVCSGSTLALTAPFVAGATYSWIGPSGFTSSLQNPSISNVTFSHAGVYTVTVSTGGCTSAPSSVNVIINPTPPAPIVGCNGPVCQGSTINLTASNITGATYSWTGPAGFTSSLQNPSRPNANSTYAGIYIVNATVNGCTGPSASISVAVQPLPVANAGANATVCANNGIVNLSGSSSTGSGQWTTSGNGIFSSPTSLSTTYTIGSNDISAGSATITFSTTNNGACASVNDQMLVTITSSPIANAGPNLTSCANNPGASLNGSFTVATGGMWSTSGTGTFTPSNTNMNVTYNPSAADIANGSVTITLTTTGNGNCVAVSDQTILTIVPSPVVNAGPNSTACVSNPNIILNGTSTTGSGVWTTSGTGTFGNANALTTSYSPSVSDINLGSVTFTLTSFNNGTCLAVSDQVTITFVEPPVINAGTDQTVCVNNSNFPINGFSATGSGVWSSSGSGTFNPNANTLNTSYQPSAADFANGSVTLTLTSTNNGTCAAVFDQMTINFMQLPTANAGQDISVCANNAMVSLSGSFTTSTGAIWSTAGSGNFNPGNSNMNATYQPGATDITAGSVNILLTTTGNGPCPSADDTILVTITNAPFVYAGDDINSCFNTAIPLSGISGTGSGTWSTLGDGSFNGTQNILNASYNAGVSDLANGSVMLILTTTANGNCNAVSDTLVITYLNSPVVNAGADVTGCAYNLIPLSGSFTSGNGSITWSTPNGSGTFTSDTSQSTNYIPVNSDTLISPISIVITANGIVGCPATSDTLLLNVNTGIEVYAGDDMVVCSNIPQVLLSGTTSSSVGVQWSSSGGGTFTPNNTTLNTAYIPSAADIANGSATIYLSATSTGACYTFIDSLVITFIPSPLVNAGLPIFICEGDMTAQLNGSVTGSPTMVQWTTTGSGTFTPSDTDTSAIYNLSAADSAAGVITLYLTSTANNGGCGEDTSIVTINIDTKPEAGFSYNNACANTPVQFTDNTTVQSGTIAGWNWTINGDGTAVEDPSYLFTSAGVFNIQLIVFTFGGCSDTTQAEITINPQPELSCLINGCADSASLSAVSDVPIISWNWNCGDSTTLSGPNHAYIFPGEGSYLITLIAVSDSGCATTYSEMADIEECDAQIFGPSVPQAFTPNGDGTNDMFTILGGPFMEFELRIFNEWGNEIFKSIDQSYGWDGTYKNIRQPLGPYVWTYRIVTMDQVELKERGEVTILK